MFSDNQKISEHQIRRLLVLDIFPSACLFLTRVLPKIPGCFSMAALLLGIGSSMMEMVFLKKFSQQNWKGMKHICAGRCFVYYTFLMSIFVSVLKENFLYTMHSWSIAFGMFFIVYFMTIKGMEIRGRLAEIFFYITLIPIILIALFSMTEISVNDFWQMQSWTLQGTLYGTVITWILMTPVEWVAYVCRQQGRPLEMKKSISALGMAGGLICLIALLCRFILTERGMRIEKWPAVILMQLVRMPGGFLSRQDGFMLSFWIFAMIIGLSGALGHSVRLFGLKEGKWIGIFGIIGTVVACVLEDPFEYMHYFYAFMILSALWLILISASKGVKKGKGIAYILIGTFILTGCQRSVSLEKRAFVMALGVDLDENGEVAWTYTFPDMENLTGKSSSGKMAPMTIHASNLSEAEVIYDRVSDHVLDYGQLKILIFGEKMVQNRGRMEVLMHELRNNPRFTRTILICQCKNSAKEFCAVDENVEGALGIYMEKLFQQNNVDTILNDWIYGQDEMELPWVEVIRGMPALCP